MFASLVAVAVAGGAVGVRLSMAHDDGEAATSAPPTTVVAASTTAAPSITTAPSTTTAPPSTNAGPRREWAERVAPLAAFVEEARGQPFERAVPVVFLDDADFVAQLDIDEPLGPDDGELASAIDRALGWIGPNVDADAAWTALYQDAVAAFYDPGRGRIVIRGEPGPGELPPEVRVVLVHELTHAWQDQVLGLDLVPENAEEDLAWSAVVEGDAMHVESQYVATLPAGEQRAWEAYEESLGAARRARGDSPIMYELAIVAPYLFGERLVAALDATAGDDRVDETFGAPPSSSEQAMFAAVHDAELAPVAVQPLPEPPGAEWIDEGDIGAWDVFTLLITRLDGRTSAQAARAWAGGTGTVYDSPAKGVCLGWVLHADDAAGAARLTSALQQWVAAGPAGAASVTAGATANAVRFETCDPGAAALTPDTQTVRDAVAWLLVHEDVVAGLAATERLPAADCAASRVLTELGLDAVSYDIERASPERFVAAARAYGEECAARTAVVG